MAIKDYGPVTAYSMAVEAGFTGTFQEWVQAISGAAGNASSAAQALSDAQSVLTTVQGLKGEMDEALAEIQAGAESIVNNFGNVDSTLSGSSANPIQNQAVYNAVNDLKSAFTLGDYSPLADIYGQAIKNDGTLNDNRPAYTTSDYIRIPELTKEIKMGNYFKAGSSSVYLEPAIAFYNENKEFISSPVKVNTQYATHPVPDNAAYIRFNQGNPKNANNNTFVSGLWFISSVKDELTSLSNSVENNASDISELHDLMHAVVSEGNKNQGAATNMYASDCIDFGATLYAGKTYAISLKFNGTYNGFLTYLNYLYIATSDSADGRVENIKSLFTAIESPLAVDKWYTVEYTPSVNVSHLGPQYSGNYTPSDSYSIDYKVVETESRIDKLESRIGNDDFYNFTPLNTWEESAVPAAITQKLQAMENDILCVFQGDSLTGLTEYSESQEEPEHCPPGMQYKSWTYLLWKNMARAKPMCDRLDSQRNSADFFTKTGTWEQVAGEKFDDDEEPDKYCAGYQTERSVSCLTYQSASSNAAVSFTFDADTYDKCSIVFSLKPDGADGEIVIAEGNGKMLVSLDRSTWVEANGYTHTQQSNPDGLSYDDIKTAGLAVQQRHRRLWMKKASGVTGDITVTYKRASSSASGSYMYCWGAERWSGNTVFVDNIGRGGRYTTYLSWNISDIFDRHPDFAVYEMPLANELDEGSGMSTIYGFYEQYFLSNGNNSYKTRSNNYTNVPLIVFLPHGRGSFFDDNDNAVFVDEIGGSPYQVAGDPPAYVVYMTIWNWLKGELSSYNNVSVINLYCRLLNEATGIGQPINEVFGSNGEYSFTRDTTHLNATGAKMYCKYLLPLFQR